MYANFLPKMRTYNNITLFATKYKYIRCLNSNNIGLTTIYMFLETFSTFQLIT